MRVRNTKERRRDREEFVYMHRFEIAGFVSQITGYPPPKNFVQWANYFVRKQLNYSCRSASVDIVWSMRNTFNDIKHLFT